MPTANVQMLLAREINQLNTQIDRKILKGKAYRRDAKRHKLLVSKLRNISRGNEKMISVSSLLTV